MKLIRNNNQLKERLIDTEPIHIENDNYGLHENEFNNLYNNLECLTNKINTLERKIDLLENNTQHNLKLLSNDIHHMNDTRNGNGNDNIQKLNYSIE